MKTASASRWYEDAPSDYSEGCFPPSHYKDIHGFLTPGSLVTWRFFQAVYKPQGRFEELGHEIQFLMEKNNNIDENVLLKSGVSLSGEWGQIDLVPTEFYYSAPLRKEDWQSLSLRRSLRLMKEQVNMLYNSNGPKWVDELHFVIKKAPFPLQVTSFRYFDQLLSPGIN